MPTSRLVFVYLGIVFLFLISWQIIDAGSISQAWADFQPSLYNSATNSTSADASCERGNFATGSNAGSDISLPPDMKIIGLVFYGRRQYVQILDCYLKRNLKSNGGLFDEVIFAVKTDIEEDVKFLDSIVDTTPGYVKYERESIKGYGGSWEVALEHKNDILIKIDDDVVFIEDNAVSAIVKRLLENPDYFAVSANVINNPLLSYVHRGLGMYEPFFPEMEKPEPEQVNSSSWRVSELPSYDGPRDGPKGFSINGSTPAPYKGHRWLPVRERPFDIFKTPARDIGSEPGKPALTSWAIAAQTHYSFFQHLEQGDTHQYKFNTWDYHYHRLSINFLGIRGRDVAECYPFPVGDDEAYLTLRRPREIGRHLVVDGGGLVAHYAFGPQYHAHGGKGILWTDILDRYQAYADEMVCPFANRSAKSVVT
ncbi:uncharacterized protein MKZ38_000459 [Zalerion maritima]|uniref:Uncharacterized protein n=1 Tax=Zalerion maritima TaxID=339359 RepID=A0AAD5WVR2_9PEZI|nr:uncharacterized protein MKZ38_000459 [Zalerion maritima]